MRTLVPAILFLQLLVCARARCGGDPHAPASPTETWRALKRDWANSHLAFAEQCLARGWFGFADAQAGLAQQLGGAEDAVDTFFRGREAQKARAASGAASARMPLWSTSDWEAYEAMRLRLHRAHVPRAVTLIARAREEGRDDIGHEIEAWALRLAPDDATLRTMRGEEYVAGMRWLPTDAARHLKEGRVLSHGTWRDPSSLSCSSWADAYEIPTEHFRLITTVPYAEALGLAGDLESAYAVWREVHEGVASLDLPCADPSDRKTFPVVRVFRTRAEYLDCIREVQPDAVGVSENPKVFGFAGTDGTYAEAFLHAEIPSELGRYAVREHIVHEMGHLFRPRTCEGQDWCAEGLASLIEGLAHSRAASWNGSVTPPPRRCGGTWSASMIGRLPDLGADAFEGLGENGYRMAYWLAHYLAYADAGAYRRDLLRFAISADAGRLGKNGFRGHFPYLDRDTLARCVRRYADAVSARD